MIRPLESIGFEVDYEDQIMVVFRRKETAIVIEMFPDMLEPMIGFAHVVDNDKNDEWVFDSFPYSIIGTAMEEASYFATYVLEMRK